MSAFSVDDGLVPADVFATILEYVVDARRSPRYADRSFSLDDRDQLAIDEDARLVLRGGFWNARDVSRIADGFTLADAKGLRRDLRALGHLVSQDEADALLAQGERGMLRTMSTPRQTVSANGATPSSAARLSTFRNATAARRAKARENGWCVVCAIDPAKPGFVDRRPSAGAKTCKVCQAAANARLGARRKAASAAKKAPVKRKRSKAK